MTKPIAESLWWLAVGCTMLHFLWVGGVIGLFALGGRRILRRASLSINYVFTLCCLLALIAAPVVLFVYVVDQMNNPRPTSAETWASEQEQDEDLRLLMENETPLVANREVSAAVRNHECEPAGRENLATSIVTSVSSVLPWVWISGTPVFLSIVMLGLAGTHRLRRRARLLHDEPTEKLGAHLAKVLGMGKVKIGLSDRIASPTVVGIVHPLILLPEVTFRQWRSDYVRMILLHELWHVRRLDNLANLVQRFIESMMFFHPIVWQVSRWARIDREHCCDSAVLRQTKQTLAYAEMLACLAGRQRWPWWPSFGVAMGEHNVVARIRRVLGGEKHSGRLPSVAITWALLVTGISSIVLAGYVQPGFLTVPAGYVSMREDDPGKNVLPSAEAEASVSRNDSDNVDVLRDARSAAILETPNPSLHESVTMRLVDEAGRPVAGAQVGLRIKCKDGHPDFPAGTPSAPAVSDRQGIFRIRSKKLLEPVGCSTTVPCFAFHADRRLAGTLNLTQEDWGGEFVVAMQPVSLVRFVLDSQEVRSAGGSLTWSKGFVRLPGNRLSYLLRNTQNAPHSFEYLLPPGRYELVAFAGSGNLRETILFFRFFEVPVGLPEVDLGVFQLPRAPRPVPYSVSNPRGSTDLPDPIHGEVESTTE